MRQYIIKLIYKSGVERTFSPTAVSPGEALSKVHSAQKIRLRDLKSALVMVGDVVK